MNFIPYEVSCYHCGANLGLILYNLLSDHYDVSEQHTVYILPTQRIYSGVEARLMQRRFLSQ
jgi:hypothetical protein